MARSTAARVGGAAVAMVIVAELAVWLLSPRDGHPTRCAIAETDYFSPAEIERAHDFRAPQRWLAIAGLALEGAVLVALALGRPASLRRRLERLAPRPLLGAAVAGAAVAVLTTLATVPLGLVAHERAVDAGLSTQSLGSWLWDLARSAGITALLTAGGTALLIALVRRFPRPLVDPGRGRGDRARDRLRLDRAGRPGPDLQPLRAAAERQPGPRRRARARAARPGSTSARSTGSTPAAG